VIIKKEEGGLKIVKEARQEMGREEMGRRTVCVFVCANKKEKNAR